MIKEIFIDMDGVVADFDKHWVARYGSKKEWCDDKFTYAILNEDLFEKLQAMPGMQILIDEAKIQQSLGCKVYMLTSVGTTNLAAGTVAAQQKSKWLKRHNIPFRPIFVSYLEQKGFYASENAVLIDDNSRATNAFVEGGGASILHTNPLITIETLMSLTRDE